MNFLQNQSIRCGHKELDLHAPAVMGILNLTPDSFYDGGSYSTPAEMLEKVETMLNDGASIIDIGSVSTRPGSMMPSAQEELERLVEPLKLIRKQFPDTIISVDTFRKSVAIAAIHEGADIINDVSGGMLDSEMIPYMCMQDVAYVLMHMQGTPENMQKNPHYEDVVREVGEFFLKQIAVFKHAGKENVILDPGFGFGKSVDHNFKLLSAISDYSTYCYPVMAGVSRKSMINKVLDTSAAEALNGTTVINTMALMKGAHILRVHDVKPAMEVVKLFNQYKKSSFSD